MAENVHKIQKQIPAYLNGNCFKKALKKACAPNSVKLVSWQWQLANINGGNFCSNIYRVNGTYKILTATTKAASLELPAVNKVNEETQNVERTEEFHFIIKDLIMDIAEIGTNELIMLENILPKMTRILKGTQMEGNTLLMTTTNKLAANCYFSQSNKEHEFYILDDLNALDYKLGNRSEGLSLQEAEIVLEKLAKFHATSMVYAEKNPDVIANLKPAHFAKGAEDVIAKSIVKNGMECAMEVFKNLDETILRKMQRLLTQFDDKISECVNPTKSLFNVLNHGDLWCNNILLKEQQGKRDAIFVDFQNVFWGSSSFDLYYFLYTSLTLSTLQTQRFELLYHYYKTFKTMLESFKFESIPTWSDLRKEMRRGLLIGYYVALCEFPICVMSEEDAVGFTADTFLGESDKWKSIYKTQKVCNFVWQAVLHFEELGLFDE